MKTVFNQGVEVHTGDIRPGGRAAVGTYSKHLCANYKRVSILPVMGCKAARGTWAICQSPKAPWSCLPAASRLHLCTWPLHRRTFQTHRISELGGNQAARAPHRGHVTQLGPGRGGSKGRASDPSPDLSSPSCSGLWGQIYSG